MANAGFWTFHQISWFAMAFSILCGGIYAGDEGPTTDAIRSAVAKSIPLLELGSKGSLELRKQCFNCHNQGLPIMALVTARSRGFEIDAENLKTQVEFTAAFLSKNKDRYREGRGQGGQIDTAGYALWALDYGGWRPDETTAAVTEFLLIYQNSIPHWKPDAVRPPGEKSVFTSTYVASRGLRVFGADEQKERIVARLETVKSWLLETEPADTEDRVFRLRAIHLIGADDQACQRATKELLETQRADGGWGQLDDMASDAYATGTALVALHESGGVKTSDPSYNKGLRYLLSIQKDDGSWHVVTRSDPIQSYFESGYPHGTDQFISIAAASWSTTALALALPLALQE